MARKRCLPAVVPPRSHPELTGVVIVPLGGGGDSWEALIDERDIEALGGQGWSVQWSTRSTMRYATRIDYADGKKKRIYLHRVIASRMGLGAGMVDHINRNGMDCRRENLRTATKGQNMANGTKRRNNTSGFKGVVWSAGKWVARIKNDGKMYYLGRFVDAADAARAYDAKATEVHGEFACLNFQRSMYVSP
jgi:hypothetical protein